MSAARGDSLSNAWALALLNMAVNDALIVSFATAPSCRSSAPFEGERSCVRTGVDNARATPHPNAENVTHRLSIPPPPRMPTRYETSGKQIQLCEITRSQCDDGIDPDCTLRRTDRRDDRRDYHYPRDQSERDRIERLHT
jgi:hypothetical protein